MPFLRTHATQERFPHSRLQKGQKTAGEPWARRPSGSASRRGTRQGIGADSSATPTLTPTSSTRRAASWRIGGRQEHVHAADGLSHGSGRLPEAVALFNVLEGAAVKELVRLEDEGEARTSSKMRCILTARAMRDARLNLPANVGLIGSHLPAVNRLPSAEEIRKVFQTVRTETQSSVISEAGRGWLKGKGVAMKPASTAGLPFETCSLDEDTDGGSYETRSPLALDSPGSQNRSIRHRGRRSEEPPRPGTAIDAMPRHRQGDEDDVPELRQGSADAGTDRGPGGDLPDDTVSVV